MHKMADEDICQAVVPFLASSTICVSGCSQSGKTTFVAKLLKHLSAMFTGSTPKKVLYCFSLYQPLFDDIQQTVPDITFQQGIPTLEELDCYIKDNDKDLILILDDLIHDIVQCKETQLLFTQYAHHRNITIIYMTQNLFMQGKYARTIALNTHVYVVFRNFRDASSIKTLAQQINPGRPQHLTDAFQDATSCKYGYLVIDLGPHTNDKLRLRTNIFPDDKTVIYLPK